MIDIVIVNYKSTSILKHCLSAIYSALNGNKAKVYIIDNASNDQVELLESEYPEILLTKNDRNVGFSRAVNQIIRRTSNPYIVILNPDTFVYGGFFDAVISFMEQHSATGILGPRILNSDGSIQGSARSFPTFHTALFGHSSMLSKMFPNNPITRKNVLCHHVKGDKSIEVDWVSGACMMVRREALKDVGFLDERFFMYWEDADLCRRMWSNGWKVNHWHGATSVHLIGRSSSRNLLRSIFEFHKSALLFYIKNNRRKQSILTPLVFMGLAARFFLVLFIRFTTKVLFYKSKEVRALCL